MGVNKKMKYIFVAFAFNERKVSTETLVHNIELMKGNF